MRAAFRGAKAIVFCATAQDGNRIQHSVDRLLGRSHSKNMPQDVDYMGLKNVAEEAVTAGASRLIVVSSTGVARPLELKHLVERPLASTASGQLVWKRRGELAVIEACRKSGLKTSYTIIRAGTLGDSDWKESHLVMPWSAKLTQGDYIEVRKSRGMRRTPVLQLCRGFILHCWLRLV